MGFCAVSLPASSFLTRSLLFCYICSALLSAGRCHCPLMEPCQYLPRCCRGRRCCAFPFLLRDPVAVCAQTWQGAPPESWDPVLPAREGSKTSRVGMTFTRACSTVLQGWQGKGIVLWFVLAAESQGFRQKMFIKNTHCKCYPSSPGQN